MIEHLVLLTLALMSITFSIMALKSKVTPPFLILTIQVLTAIVVVVFLMEHR